MVSIALALWAAWFSWTQSRSERDDELRTLARAVAFEGGRVSEPGTGKAWEQATVTNFGDRMIRNLSIVATRADGRQVHIAVATLLPCQQVTVEDRLATIDYSTGWVAFSDSAGERWRRYEDGRTTRTSDVSSPPHVPSFTAFEPAPACNAQNVPSSRYGKRPPRVKPMEP